MPKPKPTKYSRYFITLMMKESSGELVKDFKNPANKSIRQTSVFIKDICKSEERIKRYGADVFQRLLEDFKENAKKK